MKQAIHVGVSDLSFDPKTTRRLIMACGVRFVLVTEREVTFMPDPTINSAADLGIQLRDSVSVVVRSIADRLREGEYTTEDIGPDFSQITVEMVWQAAAVKDLGVALDPLRDALCWPDLNWLADEIPHWPDYGVQERVETIMDWLLAVREGRA